MAVSCKIVSYNMHGYDNGLPLLTSVRNAYDIILVQENWLLPSQIHKFGLVNNAFNYYANSAIDYKHGRPSPQQP